MKGDSGSPGSGGGLQQPVSAGGLWWERGWGRGWGWGVPCPVLEGGGDPSVASAPTRSWEAAGWERAPGGSSSVGTRPTWLWPKWGRVLPPAWGEKEVLMVVLARVCGLG